MPKMTIGQNASVAGRPRRTRAARRSSTRRAGRAAVAPGGESHAGDGEDGEQDGIGQRAEHRGRQEPAGINPRAHFFLLRLSCGFRRVLAEKPRSCRISTFTPGAPRPWRSDPDLHQLADQSALREHAVALLQRRDGGGLFLRLRALDQNIKSRSGKSSNIGNIMPDRAARVPAAARLRAAVAMAAAPEQAGAAWTCGSWPGAGGTVWKRKTQWCASAESAPAGGQDAGLYRELRRATQASAGAHFRLPTSKSGGPLP